MQSAMPASSATWNTLGVLSETEVLFVSLFQGKRSLRSLRVPSDIGDPRELLEFCWQTGLRSIWVMPGIPLSRLATRAWFEQQANPTWGVIPHSTPHEPTRLSGVVLWPRGRSQQEEARRLTLVFPEHARWNWVLPDARSLLATVTYLDQVLAWPLIDSPEIVASHLLSELTRDQRVLRPRSPQEDGRRLPEYDDIPFPLNEQARDLGWMRPLALTEQRHKYLHKYTHLSWALEAGLTVQLGAGAPEYSANGRAYDGMRPGIWRIQAERVGSIFDGKLLPSSLESEWMSTPQVKCCQNLSYQVVVREGYSWSQAYAFLNPWAKTLWQAAQRVSTNPQHYRHLHARENTLRTITQLTHLSLLLIASDEHARGWDRPDWWSQIVGQSRALVFTHLADLARKGTMPLLVNHDAVWVTSNDPNPLTAIPGLVTARKWNGYRVGYEVALPLSREVQAALRRTEDPNQTAAALDTLAGEDSL